jgi:3-hydroxyacyl-CoA dehydrogenase/enoyl-CoA hydratase/3-hydroxybutyryl-CoA epimerase
MAQRSEQHWTRTTDEGGVVWLVLDQSGSGTNVLSGTVLQELEELLGTLHNAPPAGVVFASAKPNGFIAGADVKEFTRIRGREDALGIIRRGQAVMDRIDALPCPSVALINGFCLGGGLELALACDYRVAVDGPGTRLGFPEVRIGIHPGFGGSVRSIRVLGPVNAMTLMLTGRTLDGRRARRMGLLDQVVPLRHLHRAARELIDKRPPAYRPPPLSRLPNLAPLRPVMAYQMRRQTAAKVKRDHYPAPFALIELWRRHGADERRMMEAEARSVAALSMTETARNLVRVFLLQDLLKAQGERKAIEPRRVHVVGAGVMGGDIATWCALQGFQVSVQDPDHERLGAMFKRAARSFHKRLRSARQVTAALDRLTPDSQGYGLRQADVVIEAIFEDLQAKQALYREIEPRVNPRALIATNTSSLPIETLAQALEAPARLVGLHFFNPVAKLPLVEIVQGKTTDPEVVHKALGFARHIDKLPLKVNSAPGFLVNRILMPYLLEAVRLEDEGVAREAIDKAATEFGMPMGPLELADTVGLDVGLHVGEILARAYGFDIPERLRSLVSQGRLGRKTGQGFYVYRHGNPVRARLRGADLIGIQRRLIGRLIDEAAACLRAGIVESADLVDAGVIFGTGFAPFRGGPLHYRSHLSQASSTSEP